jgi:hypothetical protein
VLPAEHLLDLARLDLAGERVERRSQLRLDRLALLRPLDQDAEVVGAFAQRRAQLAILLEPAPPLQQLLRGRLVLPEIRRGDPRLDLRQLLLGPRGVKDSSADRRRASSGPGTV